MPDDARKTMEALGLRRRLQEPLRRERLDDESRERLKKLCSTKVMTATVGALARFEEAFGFLWGHGLPWSELTERQREERAVWKGCRNAILDNGNDQAHALGQELDLHSVRWLGHRYHFEVGRPDQEPGNQ